ncbi:MAG: hypothetical protein E7486_02075 [Ruminococcaceae bacterium]|nr:hypothetical protein [Oscillospiraceae bacterium]
MAKKIKRYNRIYRGRRKKTVLRIILFILLAALLVFLGFSLMQAISSLSSAPSGNSSSVSSGAVSTSSEGESSTSSTSSTPSEPEKTVSGVVRELPRSSAGSEETLRAFAKNAAEQGASALLLTLKDEAGYLHFSSANKTAKDAGALAADPVDLSMVAGVLKEENLELWVSLHCFRDTVASRYLRKDGAVMFQTDEVLWLDNSASAGGVPWLNPFLPGAQNYNLSLVEEVCGLGADVVLLESVQMPTRGAENLMYLGGNGNSYSNVGTVLNQFVKAAEEAAAKKDGKVVCAVAGEYLYSTFVGNMVYGPDPFAVPSEYFAPSLRLSDLSGAKIGGSTLSLSDPKSAFSALFTDLAAKSGAETGVPIVIAEGLSQEELTDITAAAKNAGYPALIIR